MIAAALTSLALGLLSAASPCVLPLYPGFLAYLSGMRESPSRVTRYGLGFLVLAGVLSMMLALGALIAGLAVPLGRALAVAIPLVDGTILLLGLLLLANRNPFRELPQVNVPGLRHPWLNAYLYGVLYGPLVLPCSGPLVVAIFALSLTVNEAVQQLWVFLWFGLGLGIPLLALSLLSGALQTRLTRHLVRRQHALNIIGGILLIAVAAYDLFTNWRLLVLSFSSSGG